MLFSLRISFQIKSYVRIMIWLLYLYINHTHKIYFWTLWHQHLGFLGWHTTPHKGNDVFRFMLQCCMIIHPALQQEYKCVIFTLGYQGCYIQDFHYLEEKKSLNNSKTDAMWKICTLFTIFGAFSLYWWTQTESSILGIRFCKPFRIEISKTIWTEDDSSWSHVSL